MDLLGGLLLGGGKGAWGMLGGWPGMEWRRGEGRGGEGEVGVPLIVGLSYSEGCVLYVVDARIM